MCNPESKTWHSPVCFWEGLDFWWNRQHDQQSLDLFSRLAVIPLNSAVFHHTQVNPAKYSQDYQLVTENKCGSRTWWGEKTLHTVTWSRGSVQEWRMSVLWQCHAVIILPLSSGIASRVQMAAGDSLRGVTTTGQNCENFGVFEWCHHKSF